VEVLDPVNVELEETSRKLKLEKVHSSDSPVSKRRKQLRERQAKFIVEN
jgi:hypothetical protein